MSLPVKVSILIPVYNVERYLSQCMDSIISQTLEQIEIICIDDGSTDNSGKILDCYAKNDHRIKVIHKENTGYGHSMNEALKVATGEYIGIVESDDFAEQEMFENLYSVAKENKLDCIKTNYYAYSNEGKKLVEAVNGFDCDVVFSNTENMCKFNNKAINIWAGLYRRKFLLENNISFLETPGASYQDLGFWFKVYVAAKRCMFKKTAYLNYRVDNETSSVKSKNKVFNICQEMDSCKAYLLHNGYDESTFMPYFNRVLYDVYQWNLNRIEYIFCSEFIKKTASQLMDICINKYNSRSIFSGSELVDITWWHECPDTYVEHVLQQKLMDIYDDTFIYKKGLLGFINEADYIYIYGAGIRGKRIKKICNQINPLCKTQFIVSSLEETNAEDVEIIDSVGLNTNKKMIIAVKNTTDKITMAKRAQERGFTHILVADDMLMGIERAE